MKLNLFVSDSFARCRDAERVWGHVATETGLELKIVDINSDDGRTLAQRLGISMVPALTVDDRLLSVGVPTMDEVRTLLWKL
jgi:thioredoxin-like negative regulator of GroEL